MMGAAFRESGAHAEHRPSGIEWLKFGSALTSVCAPESGYGQKAAWSQRVTCGHKVAHRVQTVTSRPLRKFAPAPENSPEIPEIPRRTANSGISADRCGSRGGHRSCTPESVLTSIRAPESAYGQKGAWSQRVVCGHKVAHRVQTVTSRPFRKFARRRKIRRKFRKFRAAPDRRPDFCRPGSSRFDLQPNPGQAFPPRRPAKPAPPAASRAWRGAPRRSW
jgi:hypothetical protein